MEEKIPFAQVYECPKCLFVRTSQMKPLRQFCRGQKCEAGEGPHLHVQCGECSYQFLMDTADAPRPETASS